MARRLVTLTTDFGAADPYVAAMKGVILTGSPPATIVDVSHDLPPHDVLAGAFMLESVIEHFPPGTLHVVVVDPGVGTDREILVARFGDQFVLFPDNGVATMVAKRLPLHALHAVRNERYLPTKPPSHTFHGRDIFAPVAAEILNGLDISRLGPQPARYKLLDVPTAERREHEVVGQVIHVDRFGNLISNITDENLPNQPAAADHLRVHCGECEIGRLVAAYGHAEPDALLALVNSMGYVEIAVNGASAAERLGAGVGTPVRVVES
jgi:hypothetical protein